MCRELTRDERKTIRRLVTGMCANYDSDYGCLPLDCPCYMLGKWWTGSLCRYFRAAVLPLAPVLEASLTGEAVGPETRRCMRKCLYPRGAASLLLRSLQGRGQPPQEPGAHEKKAAEKQGPPLRLGPENPLYLQGLAGLFCRPSYLSASGFCFAG